MILNEANQFVATVLDLGGALVNFITALGCLTLAGAILKEKDIPYISLQRISLYLLSGTAFNNAFTYWPEWALIAGHRPPALLEYTALATLVCIMVFRGALINGHRLKRKTAGTAGTTA
jgi:hypothetical protein